MSGFRPCFGSPQIHIKNNQRNSCDFQLTVGVSIADGRVYVFRRTRFGDFFAVSVIAKVLILDQVVLVLGEFLAIAVGDESAGIAEFGRDGFNLAARTINFL